MFSYFDFVSTLLVLSIAAISHVRAECFSYGMDFQHGGNYFINSLDNSEFTSVVEFEGCVGTANVILEAPNGDSWLCTDVDASRDDFDQLSTCPISKSAMYSGTWIIVILDNNGDGPSFSSQKTFTLLVAPQQTVTETPTVSITSDVTPIFTSTIVSTESYFTTLPPVTISTVTTAKGIVTITPPVVTKRVTVTSSNTRTFITHLNSIVFSTKTATCSVPTRAPNPDPLPRRVALDVALSLVGSPTGSASFPSITAAAPASKNRKRDVPVDPVMIMRRKAVARLLEKRAPDVPTSTLTDTNTAHWITSTVFVTHPTVTTSTTSTTSPTLTITPAPITYITGTVVKTITLSTSSRTYTSIIRTTTTTTKTSTHIITIKTTVTPSTVLATCSEKGGIITAVRVVS